MINPCRTAGARVRTAVGDLANIPTFELRELSSEDCMRLNPSKLVNKCQALVVDNRNSPERLDVSEAVLPATGRYVARW